MKVIHDVAGISLSTTDLRPSYSGGIRVGADIKSRRRATLALELMNVLPRATLFANCRETTLTKM